jgi:lactoylglutathione lyase
MPKVHHTAVCVRDIDESLRFWVDGLGFEVIMDHEFSADWNTLLRADTTDLRAVFLGDPTNFDSGILELVDFGDATTDDAEAPEVAVHGFLLVSVMAPLEETLEKLAEMGLGGEPRRIRSAGVDVATIRDPDGVWVELMDTAASDNLDRLAGNAGEGATS